jgi:hypothetical protein
MTSTSFCTTLLGKKRRESRWPTRNKETKGLTDGQNPTASLEHGQGAKSNDRYCCRSEPDKLFGDDSFWDSPRTYSRFPFSGVDCACSGAGIDPPARKQQVRRILAGY